MRDSEDVRLHMDGLFELKQHALHFVNEFAALYTNGPAGGGGIRLKKKLSMRLFIYFSFWFIYKWTWASASVLDTLEV